MGACLARNPSKPKPIFGSLDLLRIALADGADGVTERDAALQEIEIAEKFQLFWIEEPRAEADLRNRLRREDALVSEVVDGEKSLDADERGVGREMFAQIHGRERGLPVVRVNDVRGKEIARDVESGHRENCEPDMVIRMVDAGKAIDTGPVK